MKINVLQRIVLILGAILMLIDVFSPEHPNGPVLDWTGVLMRFIGIFLTTVLLFFALATRKD